MWVLYSVLFSLFPPLFTTRKTFFSFQSWHEGRSISSQIFSHRHKASSGWKTYDIWYDIRQDLGKKPREDKRQRNNHRINIMMLEFQGLKRGHDLAIFFYRMIRKIGAETVSICLSLVVDCRVRNSQLRKSGRPSTPRWCLSSMLKPEYNQGLNVGVWAGSKAVEWAIASDLRVTRGNFEAIISISINSQ